MRGDDQQSIMNSLTGQGPEAWGEYLRSFEDGRPLTGLNMQVIFNYAAPLAKIDDNLHWAEVAVRAAELEALNSTGVERENAQLWAMNLRGWFIARMGSRPDNLVLDKSLIVRWIADGLKSTPQAIKEKANGFWKRLEMAKQSSNSEELNRAIDDLRELTRIKHRLDVAAILANCGELPVESHLEQWLQIRKQLP